MAIREGKWRCTYCSNVNRGAELACAGCGAQRDKDVVFFLEDDAPEVTDEGLLAVARAGADWLCQFCQTSNRPALTHCVQCGAEKGTSPSRPVRELLGAALPAAPLSSAAPAVPKAPQSRGCMAALVVLLLLGMGFCATLTYFALRKTNETLSVAGFEWQRTIAVEAFRTVRESAWEDSVPRGARVVSRQREVHHTDQVQTGTRHVKVGTRDKGNGFFEDVYEDRPIYSGHDVYAVKITYDVERWLPARNAEDKGGDRRPRWPDVSLGSNEREAMRTETYVVRLAGTAKTYRMELPLARWEQLEEGRRYDAVIQGGRTVLELK
jgi:Zn-finger in Ran binding protein and others